MYPHQVAAWIAAGEAALGETPPPAEKLQCALAALLRPMASISLYVWLRDLANGLDALSFGEVLPIMTPSDRGLTGKGKGRTAWKLRLSALRWVEFQVAAHKVRTKTEGYEIVAGKFSRGLEAVKAWRSDAAEVLGTAVVREALEHSRRIGEFARTIREQVVSGTVDERYHSHLMYLDQVYSDQALEQLAAKFKALPRKKG